MSIAERPRDLIQESPFIFQLVVAEVSEPFPVGEGESKMAVFAKNTQGGEIGVIDALIQVPIEFGSDLEQAAAYQRKALMNLGPGDVVELVNYSWSKTLLTSYGLTRYKTGSEMAFRIIKAEEGKQND